MGFLSKLLVLLAVATAGVALSERLKLPAIAGFLHESCSRWSRS